MSIWAVCLERDTYGSWESAGEQSPNLIRPQLGVLFFLIDLNAFFFILCLLEAVLGYDFLFSVLFFYCGVYKNCFVCEKFFRILKYCSEFFTWESDKNKGFLPWTLPRIVRVAFTTYGSNRPLSEIYLMLIVFFLLSL